MEGLEETSQKNGKVKLGKRFSLRRKTKKSYKENDESPPASELKCKENKSTKKPIKLAHLHLSKPSNFDKLLKRKDAISPGLPKKKPFRKTALPLLPLVPQTNNNNNGSESPSAFECEFADQENQSLNDPDFVRRTSFRWKQKYGMSKAEYLEFLHANRSSEPIAFQWPTYPSQQPVCQKSVSCMPDAHESVLHPSGGKSPAPVPKQYSSFHIGFEEETAISSVENLSSKDGMIGMDSDITMKSRTSSFRLSFRKPPSMRNKNKNLKVKALDDSVTDAILKAAEKEQMKADGATVTSLFGQLHLSRNKSFRMSMRNGTNSFGSSKNYNSSLATSSSCPKNLGAHSRKAKLTSSSCHTELSSWENSFSPSNSHPNFEDIFVAEPAIAEKFAIMFPSEPRPEWHRHLRQVLHKAGQKIFKKPEQHDTNIPENLRYQLKQIYVY